MNQSFNYILPILITLLLMVMSPLKSDCQESKKVDGSNQKKPLCPMNLKEVEREKYAQSVRSEEAFDRTRMDGTYTSLYNFIYCEEQMEREALLLQRQPPNWQRQ